MEDMIGPSLGRVWRSEVKVTRDKNGDLDLWQKWHFSAFLATCVQFVFMFKTSLVSSFVCVWNISGNRWTDLCQIHMENMFGPSFGRV